MTPGPLIVSALLLAAAISPAEKPRPCSAAPTPHSRALIQATSNDVRAALRRVPGAKIRTARTSFLDERFACVRPGYVVSLSGSFKKLANQDPPDIWLGAFLERRGWARTSSHDADGPDGTVYALHQPGALCIVEGRWNHWDDDEGEHTADWYRLTVSCGDAEAQPPREPRP
jgi:hypothetical protein